MKRTLICLFLSLLTILGSIACSQNPSEKISPTPIKSGFEFLTTETQSLQNNDFENPGYLWVEKGKTLFENTQTGTLACIACHESDALIGASTTYPKIDVATGRLINLEGRINLCRKRHQSLKALDYENEELLSLTAYVSHLSKNLPVNVAQQTETKKHFESGQAYFNQRRGQLNLSCAQCHDQNWGKQLRGDIISQGHGNGFPTYRFEWETLGSLHRRFADCDTGVRAEPYPLGSQTYIDLEFYLAVRAQSLPIETPAIRR